MRSLKATFFKTYPENKRIIEYFEEATGCEFTLQNITAQNLHLYVELLKEKVSNNTARTYCSKVKAILKRFADTYKLPKNFEKILSVRNESSIHTYLDQEDIKRLIEYKPESKAEQIIKYHFLLGLFTGARYSDYIRFTENNIKDGFLTYTSLKTRISATIPINRTVVKALRFLDRMEGKTVFTEPYFNKTIKDICRKAGIKSQCMVHVGGKDMYDEKWLFVSSHTARRSFCTNLYINGVQLLDISRMCGHSSITMTCRYICCGPKIDKRIKRYLNSFDCFELG